MPCHTFLYEPQWKMVTSAWLCTSANFRNDGAKTRHACKLNPEDSETVSSTGDSPHHTRWQTLKKHHHLQCVQSGETRYALLPCNLLPWIMHAHINANFTLHNTSHTVLNCIHTINCFYCISVVFLWQFSSFLLLRHLII